MNKLQSPIKTVLQIIDYQGDRQAFKKNFELMCHKASLLKLVSNLEKSQQEKIKQCFSQQNRSIEEIKKALGKHLDKEHYSETLKQVYTEYIEDFIKNIVSRLSEHQIKKLLKFLEI